MKRISLLAVMILLGGLCGQVRGSQPNIIFILRDDLAYGDVGVFFQNRCKINNVCSEPWTATPKIDKLAAEGMRLTEHYCPTSVCAPSRASLLLGMDQGHANVRHNQFDKALEDNRTLGTVLKAAGYATAAVGNHLRVQFPRRFAGTTELQYVVQVSPDLVNWNTFTTSQVGSEASDLPAFEEVTFQADDAVASGPTLYLRLRVGLS